MLPPVLGMAWEEAPTYKEFLVKKKKSKPEVVKIIRQSSILTKREHYAISILPAIWESMEIKPQNVAFIHYAKDASNAAFALADAMILSSKKRK